MTLDMGIIIKYVWQRSIRMTVASGLLLIT